jgi:beta-N-acetylhexosaminidase
MLAALLALPALAIRHAPKRKPHGARRITGAPRPKQSREEQAAARWMKKLSLHDEVAQLVMIPFSGQPLPKRSKAFQQLVRLVKQEHVGGMILVNVFQGHLVKHADPVEAATLINGFQKMAKIPLLLGGDLERGASMRLNGATGFPHAMAYTAGNDIAGEKQEGAITAREARAVGIQWVFYPVADVNNNPANPIINIRSFGENPADVSRFGTAFIEGARSDPDNRVLTTAKHFPGHGDTATDSHTNIATVSSDRAHLNLVELPPFESAIAAGVDSVMTAHLSVPALEKPELPATLSKAILTDLLRQQLSFHGIIVTDALEMGGVAKGFSVSDAAVRAIEAGVDVLLMPSDPDAAISAVLEAVDSGRITRERVETSVRRILMAKARVGLDRQKTVNVKRIGKLLGQPAAVKAAQQTADRALTLVKNDASAVPLRDAEHTLFLLMTENKNGPQGEAFQEELKKRGVTGLVRVLDPQLTDAELAEIESQAKTAPEIVAGAFVSVAAYSNNVALRGRYPDLMKVLAASGKPVVLVALGSPYLLKSFPDVAAYLATYSTVPVSEVATVRGLLGAIAIGGKLPVTIPGIAAYGEGIAVSAAPR